MSVAQGHRILLGNLFSAQSQSKQQEEEMVQYLKIISFVLMMDFVRPMLLLEQIDEFHPRILTRHQRENCHLDNSLVYKA